MSGLARMLLDSGAIVTGSDPKPNEQTFNLVRRGVKISRTQMGELINRETDLVVRTAAVPDSNPEYQAARALGVPTMKYAQLLGAVMAERHGLAVAGTHGKSTTTAMIAYTLIRCGVDASFVVGGSVPQLGGGSHSGVSKYFVAEACEYDRSFHNLHPTVALITNIEEDHLDCYRNLDEIVESFHRFAALVPQSGLIIANAQDANVARALTGAYAPVATVGMDGNATWNVIPDQPSRGGGWSGVVQYHGHEVARLKLLVAGLHNLMNATMALAACHACGVDPAAAAQVLNGFIGVDRRMTEVGQYNQAIVVDDYGHHPTEIQATLAALREKYQPRRLICVFQPHQHSRTRFLLDDFARSFVSADQTIVPDIYFVRDSEADRRSVSSADLVERVKSNGQHAVHIPDFPGIVEHLRAIVEPGDLVVTMGAGNVWEIGRELAE